MSLKNYDKDYAFGIEPGVLSKYVNACSSPEHPLLLKLRQKTVEILGDRSIMVADSSVTRLLQTMVQLGNHKKILECGVFTGYTTLALGMVAAADAKIYALDIDESYMNHGKPIWEEAGITSKIVKMIGPAVESMDKLISEGEEGTFDFIFVDADKSNYPVYYEKGLMLLKQGGILAIDNTIYAGRIFDESDQREDTRGIRAVNDKLRSDARVTANFTIIGDGLAICMKN